jgi:hypothetical protein
MRRKFQQAVPLTREYWSTRNRHGDMEVMPSPATPPGTRVRIGQFDGLRFAGKPGHSQPVEESVRQRKIERHRRVGREDFHLQVNAHAGRTIKRPGVSTGPLNFSE